MLAQSLGPEIGLEGSLRSVAVVSSVAVWSSHLSTNIMRFYFFQSKCIVIVSSPFRLNSTSSTLELLFQTTRLIADELFSEVSGQVSQQPNTTLDQNNNLKRKRQCKIWRFSWPKLGSLEPLLKITRGTKKTISSLDRSGRQLSCEPIQVVRVSCKPFSNKWLLSCLDVSRGLFSLVQSALALF